MTVLMSADHAPDDFHWVGAQAKCSTQSMFEQLRAGIQGQSRFAVGEAVYADWEIRRMALEQLFFEEADDAE